MKDLCFKSAPIISLLMDENHRQLKKWGVQDHDPFMWLAFTLEELGELSEAINEWHFRGASSEDVVNEAVQTATLALKIAEMFIEEGNK